MPIESWSEQIVLVNLPPEPDFTEEMQGLVEYLEEKPADVVLNFDGVEGLNSSNIAHLLRARQQLVQLDRRLMLTGINDRVWSVLSVTGLDQVFEFAEDVGTALAALQMDRRS
jgi:anti-anti-sigma factor